MQDLVASVSFSHYRQQQPQSAQLGSGSVQPISSPTLQLDLLDTRQLALGCVAENHHDYSSRIQGATSLPTEGTCHSAADSGPGVPTSSSGQHDYTSSQPICRDHRANSSQSLLPGSNTYQQQPSNHETSSLGADQMLHRPLSGFLTPLGKLAGMFGWTPGKPYANHRPLDSTQVSQAAAAPDDVHHGRKQLTELARPANAAAVPQEVSASMLQVKPLHLTLQQLQDLQKAAALLSPRSMSGVHAMQHSPSHAIVSTSLGHPDAQGSLATQQVFPQQPGGQITATAERQLPSAPDVESDGSPDSSSNANRDAVMVSVHGNAAGSTQDDNDMLAAALASRLAMMAPHLSFLHSQRGTCSGIDANNSENQGKACSPKRKRSAEEPMHQQCEMQVTGFAGWQKIGKAQRHEQDFQHVLQQCPSDHTTNVRKRFRKTTGLEVLQRCMLSSWHNQNRFRHYD